MERCRVRWAAVAVLLGVALCAPAAHASFHLMKVREVFTGGASGGSYVELQMFSGGQNFVGGHDIGVYSPSGTLSHEYVMSGSVSSGANQKTVLIAGPGYSGPAADFTDAGLDLPASGGAVCFTDAEPPDCVSWGNFTGGAMLPAPGVGGPASPGGVTAGKALLRSIAPGCPTLLEAADDSDSSAVDFSEQEPNPRPNSAAVVESQCTFPNTSITSASVPAGTRTTSTSIDFEFAASPTAGATFECKLDAAGFSACTSPKAYAELDGEASVTGTPHTFQVRAVNSSGPDSTPASHGWTVDLVAPTATITAQPDDPSPGGSASFSFAADESVSGFECELKGPAPAAATACSSGKTYTGLPDGSHTFEVGATDLAGNDGPLDSYTWTVDNSLADTTPPDTTITARPDDPSASTTATYSYESNEPESTFECKMDAAAFSPCSVSGAVYAGLAEGSHTFQVRARDSSGNVDPTPAGHTFAVVLSVALPPAPPLSPAPLPQPPAPVPQPPARERQAPPQTRIVRGPRRKTADRTPTFRFRASVRRARFLCFLDGKRLRRCRSPLTTKRLRLGRHRLRVAAIAGGLRDRTPAVRSFKVVRRR